VKEQKDYYTLQSIISHKYDISELAYTNGMAITATTISLFTCTDCIKEVLIHQQ